MALAPRVVHEEHLAGFHMPGLALARVDLYARVQVHDVLPSGRRVPVEIAGAGDLAKDDARGRLARRDPAGRRGRLELHLDVLEVRLALLVCVEADDLHCAPS